MVKPMVECNSPLPSSSLKPSSDHHKPWAGGSTPLLTRSSLKTSSQQERTATTGSHAQGGTGGSVPPAASHLLNLSLAAKDAHVCIRTPQLPG